MRHLIAACCLAVTSRRSVSVTVGNCRFHWLSWRLPRLARTGLCVRVTGGGSPVGLMLRARFRASVYFRWSVAGVGVPTATAVGFMTSAASADAHDPRQGRAAPLRHSVPSSPLSPSDGPTASSGPASSGSAGSGPASSGLRVTGWRLTLGEREFHRVCFGQLFGSSAGNRFCNGTGSTTASGSETGSGSATASDPASASGSTTTSGSLTVSSSPTTSSSPPAGSGSSAPARPFSCPPEARRWPARRRCVNRFLPFSTRRWAGQAIAARATVRLPSRSPPEPMPRPLPARRSAHRTR